jgi:hypothetical protein
LALTSFQIQICRLLADSRKRSGQSYVAGGAALNCLCNSTRISHDLDLFHDTKTALIESYSSDIKLLSSNGFTVKILREYLTFFEALVEKGSNTTILEWVIDSAYRFYPLIEHEELGLTLSPFDLATNKALALVGRLEVRDWVDVMECHAKVQPLGYLLWAACGKDEGYNPEMILTEARRSSRYQQAELDTLEFAGPKPMVQKLSLEWRQILSEAEVIMNSLPLDVLGCSVHDAAGELYRGTPEQLIPAIAKNELRFHRGCIQGSLPRIGPR